MPRYIVYKRDANADNLITFKVIRFEGKHFCFKAVKINPQIWVTFQLLKLTQLNPPNAQRLVQRLKAYETQTWLRAQSLEDSSPVRCS